MRIIEYMITVKQSLIEFISEIESYIRSHLR